ncbi:MAG: hypothetical protein J5966_01155 [Lachnospiraceae bacterium]|nr:hypothetical protein [Lachnospiraceae bacterium]
MSLSLNVKRIEETCEVDSKACGAFILSAGNSSGIAFMIRCSHRCIRLSITDHNGRIPDNGLVISYEIDPSGFDPGTVFKGNISIISNQGEERLPVTLSVVKKKISSSIGQVRNLFHFTNLAKEDFAEAAGLFYSEEAKGIFEGGERDTFLKYRAFSACGDSGRKYEDVEEFLIETGKKNPVLLNFAEGSVMEQGLTGDKEISVTVRRSGWGYSGFTAASTDDFVQLYKTGYGIEDFEGNFAEIRFKIRHDKLHAGHNFAQLILSSLHSRIYLPVFVDMPGLNGREREAVRSRHTATARLMNEFINFRIGNISGDEWISRSNRLIERLLLADRNDPESRLMQAQLLLASKRYNEADIVLGAVEREMDQRDFTLELAAYYTYLRAMCDQDEKELDRAVRKVWDLYHRSDESWRILWILIYLDETIKMSPERERALIEDQVMRGMRSPVMYLEAYSILSNDPSFIKKLSDFEINVLGFAVRRGLLKKEIADQVAILSQRMRGFDPRVIKIMGAYFNEFNDSEMLVSICSYLIRNEVTDGRYFPYFEKAVERDLGVTNLYDFYLYTMKRSSTRLLPKNVLMYYSFQNNLPPVFRSYVYANMIVNEKEAGMYLTQSLDSCAEFAASEIMQGHMDENLAIIIDYLRFFRDVKRDGYDLDGIDREILKNGFLHLVLVNDPKIRTVTVVEDAFKEERTVAVKGGRAYISIYDIDHELFFQDEEGRRYGGKYTDYEEIKLLRLTSFLESTGFVETDDPGLWVALSENGRSYISINDRNVSYVRSIIDSALFSRRFKEGLLTGLLRYYFDNDMQNALDELLSSINVGELTMEERNEYVRFCSIKGDDDEAYNVIKEYGSYGMDPRILMRIATRFIEDGRESDPVLLETAAASFRGNKYNEEILDFVSRYYEGTVRELKDIWRACLDFDADASVIEGRIIEQMLATGAYIGERDEIFFDYLKGDTSIRVVGEYFRKTAEDDFLRDTLLDDRLYIGLLEYAIDEELSDIEALCLIRFFVNRRDMRSDRILFPYIRDLAERDIVFDFFLPYSDLMPALKLFSEEVFIEYRTDPGSRVMLNYCLEGANESSVSYKNEIMRELYPGVYQSRGVVFPGETLQYYITVEGKGHEGSNIERSEERLTNGDSRYEILQDALTSLVIEDMESFAELAEDYIIKDRIVREVIWGES